MKPISLSFKVTRPASVCKGRAQLNTRGEGQGGESKTATAAAATTVAKPPSCNAMVRSQSGNGRSLEKYIFGCNFEEI